MTENTILAISGISGFLFVTIIDRLWFKMDYKKVEKGLEVLEHYHYGIALFAVSFVVLSVSEILSFTLLLMGAAFIYHESKQKNYFSYTSNHFKNSTIIGVLLAVIAGVIFFLVVN